MGAPILGTAFFAGGFADCDFPELRRQHDVRQRIANGAGHNADHAGGVRAASSEAAARRTNVTPSATYHFHLGMALAAKGDRAGARREIESALHISDKPGFPEADEARKTLATL